MNFSAEIDVDDSKLYRAVGVWIRALLDVEVIVAQVNRVPMPLQKDFVIMTSLMMEGLSQNRETWHSTEVITNRRSTQWHCQIDVFGEHAQKNATILATMAKTDWSCIFFKRENFTLQPLYATTPTNLTFINAESEYELRYSFTLMMQYNPKVTVGQRYFSSININLAEVDSTFKPQE